MGYTGRRFWSLPQSRCCCIGCRELWGLYATKRGERPRNARSGESARRRSIVGVGNQSPRTTRSKHHATAKYRGAVRRPADHRGLIVEHSAWSTFGPHSIGAERFPTVSSGASFAQVAGAILGKQAGAQNPDKDEVVCSSPQEPFSDTPPVLGPAGGRLRRPSSARRRRQTTSRVVVLAGARRATFARRQERRPPSPARPHVAVPCAPHGPRGSGGHRPTPTGS
jgi:hypothetical protein